MLMADVRNPSESSRGSSSHRILHAHAYLCDMLDTAAYMFAANAFMPADNQS